MKTITNSQELDEKINFLREKRNQELEQLKNQFHTTYESFKPLNFIKDTFHDMVTSPEVKTDMVSGVFDLTTNFLSSRIGLGPNNPLKSLVRKGLNFVVGKLIGTKNKEKDNTPAADTSTAETQARNAANEAISDIRRNNASEFNVN